VDGKFSRFLTACFHHPAERAPYILPVVDYPHSAYIPTLDMTYDYMVTMTAACLCSNLLSALKKLIYSLQSLQILIFSKIYSYFSVQIKTKTSKIYEFDHIVATYV